MNLYRVHRHMSRVAPTWQEFQRNNSGFERVTFYAYTGEGGMFSAIGEVASIAYRAKLREFMESTNPPRPVHLSGLRVLELEEAIQAGFNAKQSGADQSATAPESKPEGEAKPQPGSKLAPR